ncbi:putative 6-phosphogluconolactonase [Candidatus Sulfopaludibacter sp. SbA4]|nr:putative 6-phosphogluconolactonase [Candidatus Sulfopaludibacter sp. SbA4]
MQGWYLGFALAVLAGPLEGQFAYVTNSSDGTVSGYSLNPASGALTAVPGSPFPSYGPLPQAIAITSNNKFAYVANTLGNDLFAYAINAGNGALTPAAGTTIASLYSTGSGPTAVAVDATGKFVYAANYYDNDVSAFTIDPGSGALTAVAGSPFAAGLNPYAVAIHPTGRFAYVVNNGDGTVSAYSINTASGALTPVTGSPFGATAGANFVALDPTGKFAYVTATNGLSGSLSAYTINASTGALTAVAGSPYSVGDSAVAVAIHPNGKFAYAVDFYDTNVAAYNIDAGSGALTPVAGSPFATGKPLQALALDGTGKYAYGPDDKDEALAFTVNATTGTLTPMGGTPVPTGSNPVSIALTSAAPAGGSPEPVSVNPGAGSGSGQILTFTYNDPRGWQDLDVVNVLINNFLNGNQSCYLAYSRSVGVLYLVNDAGNGLLPGLALNGSGSTANSQCSVAGSGSSVSGSGNTFTLTLNLSFSASYVGNKVVYLAARDLEGDNSGWQALGTWGVPVVMTFPTVGGVTPARGSGSAQTFTFTFSDSKGYLDLGVVDMLINNFLNGNQACYLAYSQPLSVLYLVNDAGTGLSPGLTLGGSGAVSNSQCSVSSAGSSANGSGNTLTLVLNITFTAGFDGNQVIYMAARDSTGANNSGWQSMGSWTVE